MTTVYFVRHAQAENSHKEEMTRPLTEKGLLDRMHAFDCLKDKKLDAVYSSPYLRAVTTVEPLAAHNGLPVQAEAGFRERAGGDTAGIPDFKERQWRDHTFAAPGGESFDMVQTRVLEALGRLLDSHGGETLAVGCHGMMLSVLTHFFDEAFGYEKFLTVQNLTPWIVELHFEGRTCRYLKSIDPFTGEMLWDKSIHKAV